MTNIGIVSYTLLNGKLEAKWSHSSLQVLSAGEAKGDTTRGFQGKFSITYYKPNSTEPISDPLDLEITKENDVYSLTWKKEGRLIYVGIGFLVDGVLTAGWRSVEEA